MNDELIKSIKEFHIKQKKLLDEMINYSKNELISIIEREMNENHYSRNEIGRLNNKIEQLRTELNTKNNKIKEQNLLLIEFQDMEQKVEQLEKENKELKEDNAFLKNNLSKLSKKYIKNYLLNILNKGSDKE